MKLSMTMPSGHYWANQMGARVSAPEVITSGGIEIVIVTEPVSWRRKTQRMLFARHWNIPLQELIDSPYQHWVVELTEPPKSLILPFKATFCPICGGTGYQTTEVRARYQDPGTECSYCNKTGLVEYKEPK